MTLSMISAVMERLVSSTKYRISKIFRYDFDWESLELIILLESMSLSSFMYFSTTFKFKSEATLLVVITIFLLSE